MNEQMGLAQQMGEQQGQMRADGSGQGQMKMLEQIVAALQSGMSPEELIAQGVPAELVQAAMDMLIQQQQAPAESAGLAGMSMSGGM
jgi:hypothetical protein